MISDHANATSTGGPSLAVTCAPCDGVGALPVRRPAVPRRVVVFGLALAVVLGVPGVSYAHALTYPGSATWQMRSVEWLRDHGGSPLVDRIENWYYTANRPTGSAPDAQDYRSSQLDARFWPRPRPRPSAPGRR